MPRNDTNEAINHDEGPSMFKVALLLEPLVGVDVEVEELDVDDGLKDILEADSVCDVGDNEGARLLLVADGVADGDTEPEGVLLLLGVPMIWPLPSKYAGGALYKVGSTREPKPYGMPALDTFAGRVDVPSVAAMRNLVAQLVLAWSCCDEN